MKSLRTFTNLRKITWIKGKKEYFPVLNDKQYYSPVYKKPISLQDEFDPYNSNDCQVRDTQLIEDTISEFPSNFFRRYSELRTYMSDPDKKTKRGKPSQPPAHFDHVVICRKNDYCIVLESNDASHYNKEACKDLKDVKQGLYTASQMFDKIQYRDNLKRNWCTSRGFIFIELPYTASWEDKHLIVKQTLKNISKLK